MIQCPDESMPQCLKRSKTSRINPPQLYRLGDPLDAKNLRRRASVYILLMRKAQDMVKTLHHDLTEPFVNLVFAPEERL
jgi:hypothetical protein